MGANQGKGSEVDVRARYPPALCVRMIGLLGRRWRRHLHVRVSEEDRGLPLRRLKNLDPEGVHGPSRDVFATGVCTRTHARSLLRRRRSRVVRDGRC